MTVGELSVRMSARELAEWSIEGKLREEDRTQAELDATRDAEMAKLKARR